MADPTDEQSSDKVTETTQAPGAAPDTTPTSSASPKKPGEPPAEVVSTESSKTTSDEQKEPAPPIENPKGDPAQTGPPAPIAGGTENSGAAVHAQGKTAAAADLPAATNGPQTQAEIAGGRKVAAVKSRFPTGDALIFGIWLLITVGEIAIFAGVSDRSIPHRAWVGIGLATLSGIITLAISKRPWFRGKLVKELLRDIGIAFIVAVIVSIVYEFSTRTIGQQETVVEVINRMMGAFVPRRVWGEVTDEVLRRQRIRSNVQVSFYIDHEITLADGRHWEAPKGQVILKMVYKYQLNAMSQSSARIPVEHELEFETWNPRLQLPRFIKVTVDGPGVNESKVYECASLQAISEGHRRIRLQGANAINAPGVGDSRHVTITTERLELVNAPGAYDLIMPELTAEPDGSTAPTITVQLEKIASDLDFDLETYYPAHNFERGDDQLWRFYRTMFPGQGFTVLLKRKEFAAVSPSEPTQSVK